MSTSAIRRLSRAEGLFLLRLGFAGLLLAICGCSREPAERAIPRRAIRVVLDQRFTAGRLANQEVWEACSLLDTVALVPRLRCGQPLEPGSAQLERITTVAKQLRQLPASDSGAARLRGMALLELRSGLSEAIDRAVTSLERARDLDAQDPALLNDLAVAYLEVGQRDQELQPMLPALDLVERALERDSTLVPALFNRALIFERLYMVASAKGAWSDYLAIERDDRWKGEARGHLERMQKRVSDDARPQLAGELPDADATARPDIVALAARSPQDAREYSFATLLREWGEAVVSGDTARATSSLAAVRKLAGTLDSLGADRSVSLAVGAIDALARDRVRLRELARAHVALGDGVTLYNSDHFDEATACLTDAEVVLRRLGSPAVGWASWYRAATEVQLSRFASADTRFQRVRTEATSQQPALTGKAVWALGVSQLRRGNYENAIQSYRLAKASIARAREPENEGAISYLLAEALDRAGQSADARDEAYRGLRLLSPFRRSRYLNNQLTTVAAFARHEGLSYAALAIMNEVLDVSNRMRQPSVLAWAYRARARDLIELGRRSAAGEALRVAMFWADRVPDTGLHDRVRADVQIVSARLTRRADPPRARVMLTDVVDTYARLGLNPHMVEALYDASSSAMDAGDREGARRSLDRAIDAIGRQSSSFPSAEVRATFTETVENVFDAMMKLELASGQADSAFTYLERGRVAAWSPGDRGDLPPAARGGWPNLDDVRALLPPDMVLLEYAVLPEQLVRWTVSRRGWTHTAVDMPRDSVAALVTRAIRSIQDGGETKPDSTSATARLFELLVRPIARELAGVSRIAIVPDRELGSVPFAALRDASDGRYLAERYQVRTLPSAAFFVATSRQPHRPATDGRALVVGNPAIDSTLASRLPALRGARREAEEVAELYRASRLLTGEEARRDTVVQAMRDAGVFHFAGHAVADGDRPEMSYLALAGSGADDGTLPGKEIARLSLSNLQLAVLSACSTLNPRSSHTGAVAGLAYSFLRAGAPATISTLWDVNDEVTTDLLVEFHRAFARGASAPEALRAAQLEAIRSPRPELRAPRAWAAFIYTGP